MNLRCCVVDEEEAVLLVGACELSCGCIAPSDRGTPDDNDVALLCRVIFLNREVAALMLEDIIVRIDEVVIEDMIIAQSSAERNARENAVLWIYGTTIAAAVGGSG